MTLFKFIKLLIGTAISVLVLPIMATIAFVLPFIKSFTED